MKKQMSQKGLYMGAGAGVVLFAIIGLLPGSFIGGAIGLFIATHIVGGPLGTSLLPRLIVGAAMLMGVLVAGLVFIIGTSSIGWLIGYVIDVVGAKVARGYASEVEDSDKSLLGTLPENFPYAKKEK